MQRILERKLGRLVLWMVTAVLVTAVFPSSAAAESDWTARYYNNIDLSGDPVIRRSESELNHLWGDGSPHPDVNVDNFSARWTRTIDVDAGTFRFTATMDDGMRVWVDDALVIDSWYDSQIHSVSAEVYLAAGEHFVEVEYYEAGGEAAAQLSWGLAGGAPSAAIQGWRGEYFNNPELVGQPILVRDDGQSLNFDWGAGSPDPERVNADKFSARWTRTVTLQPGTYRFSATTDDGVRLWVNGRQVIDRWRNQAATSATADVAVSGGATSLQMEYYDFQGTAVARLSWSRVSGMTDATPTPAPMPAAPTVGWTGQYFNNTDLSGRPAVTRQDAAIDFIWGSSSPIPNVVDADRFSVRWVGAPSFNAGRYQFIVTADGGVRLWVNGQMLIDQWQDSYKVRPYVGVISLPGGLAEVRLEFLEDKGLAEVRLEWMRAGDAGPTGSGRGASTDARLTATMVNARHLTVRSGPGLSFEPVGYLSRWQEVELTGYRDAFGIWVQVVLPDGEVGWTSASYLSSDFPFSELAVWRG